MVEVMKMMVTSFKRSMRSVLPSMPPTLQQAKARAGDEGQILPSYPQCERLRDICLSSLLPLPVLKKLGRGEGGDTIELIMCPLQGQSEGADMEVPPSQQCWACVVGLELI